MITIYLIVNPKGKIYVGQTNNLYNRLKSHKSSAKSNKNIILYHSIRKYGWENHVVSVLEEVDYDIKDEREIFWIKELNSFCGLNKMGMNMSLGGAQGNPYSWKHDKVRVEKASLRFSGEKNPFFGKKHDAETQKIISQKKSKTCKDKGLGVPQWGAEKAWQHRRKKIAAYNLNGDFLMDFSSTREADEYYGVSNSRDVARGQEKHTKGIVFRYYDNIPLENIDTSGIIFFKNNREIVQININKEVLNEFKNSKEAQAQTGEPHGNITRGARGKRRLRSGYFFMYKDDYEEMVREQNQVINN